MATKLITIDGEKLKNIFAQRGLIVGVVSEDCGFDSSYFSKVCANSKISRPAINLLSDRYKISYDDYKIKTEIVEAEPVIENYRNFIISEDTAKQLHQLIYSAVYEAVKRVWSE